MAETQKTSGDLATSDTMPGVGSSEEQEKDCDNLEPPLETDMPTITLGDSLQIDGVETPMDVSEPPALAAEPGEDLNKSLDDVESAMEPVPTLSLGDSDPDPVAMKCGSPAPVDGKIDDGSKKSRELVSDNLTPSEGDKVESGLVNGVSDSDKESASSDKPAASSLDRESDKAEVTDSGEKVQSTAEKPGDGSVECEGDGSKETSPSSSKTLEKSLPSRSSTRSRSKSVNYNENDFIPEIDVDTDECFIKKKQQEAPKVQNGLPVLTPVVPASQVTLRPQVTPVAPVRSAPMVSHSVMPIGQPMPHKPVQVVSRTTPAIINPARMMGPKSVKPAASLTPQGAASVSSGVSLLNAKLLPPGTVYQLYVPPVSSILSQPGSITLNQSIASSVLSSIVSQAASTIQTAANNRSLLQSSVVSSTMATPRSLTVGPAATPNLLNQLKTANIPTGYKKPEPVEWVTPKSSMEMIELARFEIGNKGFKKPGMQLKPDAEMSSATRFLFDLGLDCIKESVYSELIHIQSRRKDEGKLKPKEEEDFNKLRTVHKEVKERIGHLRQPLNKRCRCGFRTESTNVLKHHQEFARHRENDLICCQCGWETRQPQAFCFHMESAHDCRGQVEEKPAFYRCALCPFETNLANKIKSHKVKCYRTFKPDFNLSPHTLACNEVNFCLENIFYSDNVEVMRKKQEQLQAAQQKLAAQQKRLLPKESPQTLGSRLPSSLPGATNAAGLVTKATLQPFQNHFKLSPAQQQQSKLAAAAAQQFAKQNVQYRGTVKQHLQAMQPHGQPAQPQQQKNVRALLSKMNTKVGMLPQVPVPGSLAYLQQQQQAAVAARKASSSSGMTVSELLKARHPTPSQSSPQPRPSTAAFEVCEICGGYVKDRKALQVHFYYAHRIEMPVSVFERPQPPLYCATCFLRFWTAQGLQKHIDIHSNEDKNSVGVAGKCIICSHRVPNILMHMRHVHNRDLNNFLKGFKCVFCGQFFSGQHPMENHMAQAHGVVVKITVAQGEKTITGTSAVPTAASSPHAQQQQQQQGSRGGNNNQMVKGSVCVLCNLNFGRNVDLTRHCMKEHHTCMKCGMVVADRISLDRHVCLMSPVGLRNCIICGEQGFHPAYYVKHLRDKHLKRCSVKLMRLTQKELRRYVKAPPPLNSPDSPIVLDDDEDSTRQDSTSDSSFSRQSRTAAAGRVVRAEASKKTSKQPKSGESEKACDEGDTKVETAKPQDMEVEDGTEQPTEDGRDAKSSDCKDTPSEASRSAENHRKSPVLSEEKDKTDSAASNHLSEFPSAAAAERDEDDESGDNHTGKSVTEEQCASTRKRPASPELSTSAPASKKKSEESSVGMLDEEIKHLEKLAIPAGSRPSSPVDPSTQQKRGRESAEDEEDVEEAKRRKLDETTA